MAEFLTTNGTSYNIEKIIIEAKEKLILISPFLQLSKTFYERLKDASDRNVEILIVYGKDELKPNEKNSLADLKQVKLFYFENLHAKCYKNENLMVITSMNMYEFSEKNNREMGVLINSINDKSLFEKAEEEINSIIRSSEAIPLKKESRNNVHKNEISNNTSFHKEKKILRGYCIRCQERIPFNPEKPYCSACYTVWAQFENYEYEENVCHRCGEYTEVSMSRPMDVECYKEWKSEQSEA